MSRPHALPDRREQVTQPVEWMGAEWQLSAGFSDAGKVREVFVTTTKIGSGLEGLMADACVAVSLLLQMGMGAPEIRRHLAREGVDPEAEAASFLGLVVDRLAAIEAT